MYDFHSTSRKTGWICLLYLYEARPDVNPPFLAGPHKICSQSCNGKAGISSIKCVSVSLGPRSLRSPSLCALFVLSALPGVIALLVLSRAAWLSWTQSVGPSLLQPLCLSHCYGMLSQAGNPAERNPCDRGIRKMKFPFLYKKE